MRNIHSNWSRWKFFSRKNISKKISKKLKTWFLYKNIFPPFFFKVNLFSVWRKDAVDVVQRSTLKQEHERSIYMNILLVTFHKLYNTSKLNQRFLMDQFLKHGWDLFKNSNNVSEIFLNQFNFSLQDVRFEERFAFRRILSAKLWRNLIKNLIAVRNLQKTFLDMWTALEKLLMLKAKWCVNYSSSTKILSRIMCLSWAEK